MACSRCGSSSAARALSAALNGASSGPRDSRNRAQGPPGAPMSELENKFLPLYLHHRYQLTAAIKALGGVHYTYAVREGGSPSPGRVTEDVPFNVQRSALAAVLETIRPAELTIGYNTLKMIPPTAFASALS